MPRMSLSDAAVPSVQFSSAASSINDWSENVEVPVLHQYQLQSNYWCISSPLSAADVLR